MTPKQAYAILEDMYSLELAEPEVMAVIKAALTTPSMEDELAEALGEIRELSVIEWEEYAQAVDTIADKALAKYRERKK